VKLDDAIKEVVRARKRLADDQGRLARKNARAAVKAAVATVLRAMDREYPLVRKDRVARAAMTPLAKRRRENRRRQSMALVSATDAAVLASCNVRVTPSKEDPVRAPGQRSGTLWSVPTWAAKALKSGASGEAIRTATRSAVARRKLDAFLRLKGVTP